MNMAQTQISRPISDDEILKYLKNSVKIVLYDQIPSFSSVDDFFSPTDFVIILYGNTKKIGHWVSIQRLDNDTVEFFDSYGHSPDDNFLGENVHYLVRLLYQGGIKHVFFNSTSLQYMDKAVSTCGRWVVLRAMFRHIPLNKFIKNVTQNPFTKSMDLFVWIMTSDL